jgi:hypothetical protein
VELLDLLLAARQLLPSGLQSREVAYPTAEAPMQPSASHCPPAYLRWVWALADELYAVVSKIELDASVRILAMWRAGTVLASLTDYAPDKGKPSESERDGEREAGEKTKAAAELDAANLEAQPAIQSFLALLMEDPTLAALEAEQQYASRVFQDRVLNPRTVEADS